MDQVAEGIVRVTFDLPFGIDHVHCYLLRSRSGGWILVDTGLGSRDPERVWRPVLDTLDGPVESIVVTHMHPDHVGGARDVAELTGAPVFQAREDYEQCVRAWGPDRSAARLAEFWVAHGLPAAQAEAVVNDSERLAAAVHFARDPRPLEAGDQLDGWRIEQLRGHADAHIVLVRDGVLIAGDTILAGITPIIGLYPASRPDPLGDYLETLERLESMSLRVAFPGHRTPIADPADRARQIKLHHAERLDLARSALEGRPATAYDVSLALFDGELSPGQRRFALAESLAHLERLVFTERARRVERGYVAA
jgi:glyoxylase-like metal-dependent hydrolase (beta-lactamase superfamily II)